jgi:hypothetical protein
MKMLRIVVLLVVIKSLIKERFDNMVKYLFKATVYLTDGRVAELDGDMESNSNYFDMEQANGAMKAELDREYRSKMGVGVSSIDVEWRKA